MNLFFLCSLLLPISKESPVVVTAFSAQPVSLKTTSPFVSRRIVPKNPMHSALSMSARNDSFEKRRRPRLVVVGGGVGGLSTALDARNELGTKVEVIVVSDRDIFSFTPSNPWVAVKTREPKDIQLNLQELLPKHGIEFVHGRAQRLDPKRQQLTLTDNNKQTTIVDYDYLVIATGPRLAFEEITGMKESGKSVCTTPHAQDAATALQRLIAQPGPVVVGATQGASCFGPAYEYAFLLQNALKEAGGQSLVDQCPMTFVTPEPYIGHLGLDGAGNSRNVLIETLGRHNVEYMANSRVKKVEPDSVHVQELHKKTGKVIKDAKLTSRLTMLIPPFRGYDVWKSVPGLTDEKGLVLVNDHQQSKAFDNIFAVGVCVHLSRLPSFDTPVALGVPKTGYMIESMGTAVVHNIDRLIEESKNKKEERGKVKLTSKPSLHGLCITDFGGGEGAIFLTVPQISPRSIDVTVDNGFVSWLSKVLFEKYFLLKLKLGDTNPWIEQVLLKFVGIERTREERVTPGIAT